MKGRALCSDYSGVALSTGSIEIRHFPCGFLDSGQEKEKRLIYLEGLRKSIPMGNAYMPLLHPKERCAGP
jgi:hypothetical protein